MRCPKCGYNNLDGSALCNLCGELMHHGGRNHFRAAKAVARPAQPQGPAPPPAAGGGMAPNLPEPLTPDLREIRHCLVCFPLDPVKLDKSKAYDIGRSSKCSIILPVGMVSRHHARIDYNVNAYVITDLKSANGTRVNGELVTQHSLRNRDQIKIGPYVLDYYIYAGDTALVTSKDRELDQTQDITIGDPTKSINTFQGNISEMALGEIMQLLNLTRKSGNLKVQSKKKEGTVFFRSGEIVHALCDAKEGEDAIKRIVKITEGTFTFAIDDEDVPRTIHIKTSKLLVEALRSARKNW